jgi:hypothetical protein
MLEVLTYAALSADPDRGARLHIEPKLYGFCDAGHKVEFAILAQPTGRVEKAGEIRDPERLIGFIECKKVGVEQTTRLNFKTAHKDQDYLFRVVLHRGHQRRSLEAFPPPLLFRTSPAIADKAPSGLCVPV